MYSWTQSIPSEVKISEAYQMLKRQSIITEDPVYLNKTATAPVPQKTKSIFDADEEKSKVKQKRMFLSDQELLLLDASTTIEKSTT